MIVTGSTGAEPLVIRTFGVLSVSNGAGTQPIRFATRTVEALLVYLAFQDRPLGRDGLAELLWPERSQPQAHTNLRGAIYRLRQQIEPYLSITHQVKTLGLPATLRQGDGSLLRRPLTTIQAPRFHTQNRTISRCNLPL